MRRRGPTRCYHPNAAAVSGMPGTDKTLDIGLENMKRLKTIKTHDAPSPTAGHALTQVVLTVVSVVEHKHEGLPRFVCVPLQKVAPWKLEETTTVEGTMRAIGRAIGRAAGNAVGAGADASVEIGRRSLKRWDERRCWWMDLPEPLCRKAKVDTGDRVELSLRVASQELPKELAMLISKNPAARKNWERLTAPQQRMLREEIYAASQPQTRERRARRMLNVSDEP